MRDARTGEILVGGEQMGSDNGRGTSDDIDPRYPGCEGWSAAGILTAADGTVISTKYTMPANFLCYWDGDLGREVQDNIYISKWNPEKEKVWHKKRPRTKSPNGLGKKTMQNRGS